MAYYEHSGQPTIATNTDNTEKKIYEKVLQDRSIKPRKITKDVDISKESVYHISHEESGMRKLTAQLDATNAHLDQKYVRSNICKALLERFNRTRRNFCVDS